MSDEARTTCRSCGAELTGRDVYEGMCKKCREEVVLGAPPHEHVETRPRPRPRNDKPAVQASEEAIALETDVDVEADTRELPLNPTPGAPAPAEEPLRAPAHAEAPATQTTGLALIPEVAEARHHDEVIPLKVTDGEPAAPPKETAESLVEEPPTGSEAPELDFIELREVPPEEPSPAPTAAEAAHPEPQPAPTAPGAARPEPQPAPTAAEAARPEPQPLPVAPKAEQPKPQPPPGQLAPAPARSESSGLILDVEDQVAQLRPLLVELGAEVRSLRELLERAGRPPVRPIKFGFKAFFGLLLALGLTALVGLGLMALAGALFYPPALDALRKLFQAIGGG